MHATPISAGLFILASGVSAYLLASRIGLPEHKMVRVLAAMVFWEAIQIFAVQLLAALQMLGWVARVTVPALAGMQVAIVTGVGVWALTRTTSVPVSTRMQSSNHSRLPAYLFVATAVLAKLLPGICGQCF